MTNFILKNLANLIIRFLYRGGFTIIGPNDAAIIFREGSVQHEIRFPWHLAPEGVENGQMVEMPGYLAAAMVTMFALSKDWVVQFLHYYLNNEAEIEGDLETYKQQMVAAVQAEQAAAGQPETKKKTDQVLH